jgi:hypothetical protein
MIGDRVTPLNSGFMVMGIVGFFVSLYLVYGWNKNWGISFMLVFGIMLGASLYSMSRTTEESILHPGPRRKH